MQGFHDIVSTLLYALDYSVEDAYAVALHLAHTHWRELLSPDMEIIHTLVQAVLHLLQAYDPSVYAQLEALSVPPFFCVSWILTWFAHDMHPTAAITLFDFLISNHPSMILYVAAAVLAWP